MISWKYLKFITVHSMDSRRPIRSPKKSLLNFTALSLPAMMMTQFSQL